MRNFKNAILFTVLLSFVSYPSFAASDTTVYPPTNQAAGGGILYFPAGGNSSLFAIPVISDDLTAAVQAQTKAIEKQTTAISEVKDLIKKQSSIQCTGTTTNGIGFVACINTITGSATLLRLPANASEGAPIPFYLPIP